MSFQGHKLFLLTASKPNIGDGTSSYCFVLEFSSILCVIKFIDRAFDRFRRLHPSEHLLGPELDRRRKEEVVFEVKKFSVS